MNQPRKMTTYKVNARREVPVDGKSWLAVVDVEIRCPEASVLETTVTDLRVHMIESSPGSRVAGPKTRQQEGPA